MDIIAGIPELCNRTKVRIPSESSGMQQLGSADRLGNNRMPIPGPSGWTWRRQAAIDRRCLHQYSVPVLVDPPVSKPHLPCSNQTNPCPCAACSPHHATVVSSRCWLSSLLIVVIFKRDILICRSRTRCGLERRSQTSCLLPPTAPSCFHNIPIELMRDSWKAVWGSLGSDRSPTLGNTHN